MKNKLDQKHDFQAFIENTLKSYSDAIDKNYDEPLITPQNVKLSQGLDGIFDTDIFKVVYWLNKRVEECDRADCRSARAVQLIKLGKYDVALKDSNKAL